MTTIRAAVTPADKTPVGSSAPTPTPTTVPAVLLGGSEDTRLLLRGLLRLHHHRVVLEAPSAEGLDRLPASSEVKVLVVDAGPERDPAWADALTTVLKGRSDLRTLVILSNPDPALEARARRAGAQAVLVRPFAIRDFVEAVDSVAAGTASS